MTQSDSAPSGYIADRAYRETAKPSAIIRLSLGKAPDTDINVSKYYECLTNVVVTQITMAVPIFYCIYLPRGRHGVG